MARRDAAPPRRGSTPSTVTSPASGRAQIEKDPDRRGLACTIRTEIADNGTPRNRQVEPVERDHTTEALAHPGTSDDDIGVRDHVRTTYSSGSAASRWHTPGRLLEQSGRPALQPRIGKRHAEVATQGGVTPAPPPRGRVRRACTVRTTTQRRSETRARRTLDARGCRWHRSRRDVHRRP